ncbi:hypothetical protein TNCT6_74360 [Streptomyces sp. 6-11-2]|nr:hypothetical protein TNCT6_74360 [Streptomyces sp. 6-11-2]
MIVFDDQDLAAHAPPFSGALFLVVGPASATADYNLVDGLPHCRRRRGGKAAGGHSWSLVVTERVDVVTAPVAGVEDAGQGPGRTTRLVGSVLPPGWPEASPSEPGPPARRPVRVT